MSKKEFTYRGKTLEELNKMPLKEFAMLATSRARRTIQRGYDKKILKKIEKAKETQAKGQQAKPIRTHKRNLIIIPQMIGIRMGIHKGNTFEIVEIQPEMLGHFLGEMTMTRKRLLHGKAGVGATRSSTAISARG